MALMVIRVLLMMMIAAQVAAAQDPAAMLRQLLAVFFPRWHELYDRH